MPAHASEVICYDAIFARHFACVTATPLDAISSPATFRSLCCRLSRVVVARAPRYHPPRVFAPLRADMFTSAMPIFFVILLMPC